MSITASPFHGQHLFRPTKKVNISQHALQKTRIIQTHGTQDGRSDDSVALKSGLRFSRKDTAPSSASLLPVVYLIARDSNRCCSSTVSFPCHISAFVIATEVADVVLAKR